MALKNSAILHDLTKTRVLYQFGVAAQEYLRAKLFQDSTASDRILLLQHSPVYTAGIRTEPWSLPSRIDIPVFKTSRGGSITYHGPGQLVGYPILNLKRMKISVREYVHMMEETVIDAVRKYGVEAHRDVNAPGVWVGEKKLAALGVRVSRYITIHGFAVNQDPDMSAFECIIPCGLSDKSGVCSLRELLGKDCPSMDMLRDSITESFSSIFNVQIVPAAGEEISQVDEFISGRYHYALQQQQLLIQQHLLMDVRNHSDNHNHKLELKNQEVTKIIEKSPPFPSYLEEQDEWMPKKQLYA